MRTSNDLLTSRALPVKRLGSQRQNNSNFEVGTNERTQSKKEMESEKERERERERPNMSRRRKTAQKYWQRVENMEH